MFLRLFKYLWPERYLPEPEQDDPYDTDPPPRTPGPIGVLLVNLGTPDEPSAPAVRRYLAQFLSDPRVIEIPRYLWLPILHGMVLRARPRKVAPRYAGIWMEGGSPLLVYSRRQAEALQRALDERSAGARVELAMRYGNPSIDQAVARLRGLGCERILTVPLYPQYSASTTAAVVDEVARVAGRLRDQPELRFVKRFHDDPGYLDALAAVIRDYWRDNGEPQKLVLSFHGLPRQSIELGDPYYRDCIQTAAALGRRLGLAAGRMEVCFQSRFGAARWLQPYTEPTLRELARTGTTEVDVACPGFVADCIETLDEIAREGRDAFLEAGGRRLRYIPALNASPAWVGALADLVQRHSQGWQAPAGAAGQGGGPASSGQGDGPAG